MRAYLRHRWETGTSFQALGLEIGLPPSTIGKLVHGSTPTTTWSKLVGWYLADRDARDVGPTAVSMLLAIRQGLGPIPERAQVPAICRKVLSYRDDYDEARLPRPAWLAELLDTLFDRHGNPRSDPDFVRALLERPGKRRPAGE